MTETTANQPPIKASDQYEVILQAKLDDEGDILESYVFAIVKQADTPTVAARLMFERPRTGWVYLRRSPMFTGQIVR